MRLSTRLLRWYSRSGRALPWRETRDPYAILVSEVMLQQTQVSRVIPAYGRFLRKFPTLAALTRAPLGDVLRAWSGLGYNRRARDLHRIARANPLGLPRSVSHLDSLPGVGAYTAAAVACFAYGECVAFADTNIRRVLGRVLLGRVATAAEAVSVDEAELPREAADRWHHAVMDIGARYCAARDPHCRECPLLSVCRAKGAGPAVVGRRQTAYRTSDRRVRGRIVAALRGRGASFSARDLTRRIADDRAPALAERLRAEGLLVRAGRRYRLP